MAVSTRYQINVIGYIIRQHMCCLYNVLQYDNYQELTSVFQFPPPADRFGNAVRCRFLPAFPSDSTPHQIQVIGNW